MKEVLTNEEIDALLDLFESEGAPADESFLSGDGVGTNTGLDWGASQPLPSGGSPPQPQREKRVHRFDLFRPNRFSREQIQYLGKLQEVAALGISSTLSERLRLEGDCDCVLVEQSRFGSFLSGLLSPIAVFTLDLAPLNSKALLAMSCPLLFSAIDRIMGGTGQVVDQNRDLTEVEFAVVEGLVENVLQDISGAFRELVEINMTVDARPRNLALAQVVGSQDVVLSLHFQVSGDPLAGDIMMAIPHAALAPHLTRIDQAGGGMKAEDPRFKELIEEQVSGAELNVSVELGTADLKLSDLLRMDQGDLLVLKNRVGCEVSVPVEGVPKFNGRLGLKGNRMAVRLSGLAAEASAEGA